VQTVGVARATQWGTFGAGVDGYGGFGHPTQQVQFTPKSMIPSCP
jgi:hypothetical protein